MRNRLRSLGIILLGLLTVSAGGTAPAPVPVTFGPNIDLSVEKNAASVEDAETTIAVNPQNTGNMVEGNIVNAACSFSNTTDGGATWVLGGTVPTEAPGDFEFDPALAADADGNFYYSYIAEENTTTLPTRVDVLVAKSTDGGRTFPTFSVAVHCTVGGSNSCFPDKPYVVVDAQPNSPFRGTSYLSWTHDTIDGDQIRVAVSRDGAATWSSPIAISPVALRSTNRSPQFSQPVVAPDGTAYVFYADINFNTGRTSILFSKSRDGGQSWSKPASVASDLNSPGLFELKNSDPHFGIGTGLAGLRAGTNPTPAVGPDGTLYIVWVDFPSGSCFLTPSGEWNCINADVRLSVSKNGGNTWSAPVKVSDETNATDQFFPWIATHPDGLVSIFWLDKRLDPNNENYDAFYTNTFDGSTFLPNVRVTSKTSVPGNGFTFIGDYVNLAATADSVVPVWSDTRNHNPDVFTAVGHFVK